MLEDRAILDYPPRKTNEDLIVYGNKFWDQVNTLDIGWDRYRSSWYQSRESGKTPLGDAVPWMTFPAIDYLDRYLQDTHCVFEWGFGGSTLFFQQRAKEVVSIEHDQLWFTKVEQKLSSADINDNIVFKLVEAKKGKADWRYASAARDYEEMTFEDYVTAIDQYDNDYFDLVVVDGRSRMGCLAAALPKVKPGGVLLLDNANYPRYQQSLLDLRGEALQGWKEVGLAGPGPYSYTPCWDTVVWEKQSSESN